LVLVPRAFESFLGMGVPGGYMEGTNALLGPTIVFADGFDYSASGIVSHGRVWQRSNAFSDPLLFDGQDYMARVYAAFLVEIHSPANLLLTDSQGRRVGWGAGAGGALNEIPGAYYSGPNREPQSIAIPHAIGLSYRLDLYGTGVGNYRVVIVSADESGKVNR